MKRILALTIFLLVLNFSYSQSFILRTGPQMERYNFTFNNYIGHLPVATSPTVELLYSKKIHEFIHINTGLRYIPYSSRIEYIQETNMFLKGTNSYIYSSIGVPIQLGFNLPIVKAKFYLTYNSGIVPTFHLGPIHITTTSQWDANSYYSETHQTSENMFNLLFSNGIGIRYKFKSWEIGLQTEYNSGLWTQHITDISISYNNTIEAPKNFQVTSNGDYWVVNLELVLPLSTIRKQSGNN